MLVEWPGAGWDFKNLGEIRACMGLLKDLSAVTSAWLQLAIRQSASSKAQENVKRLKNSYMGVGWGMATLRPASHKMGST